MIKLLYVDVPTLLHDRRENPLNIGIPSPENSKWLIWIRSHLAGHRAVAQWWPECQRPDRDVDLKDQQDKSGVMKMKGTNSTSSLPPMRCQTTWTADQTVVILGWPPGVSIVNVVWAFLKKRALLSVKLSWLDKGKEIILTEAERCLCSLLSG